MSDPSTSRQIVFTLAVDYVRGLKEAIKAGHYDYVNENIDETNFPPGEDEEGEKEAKFRLFHFGRSLEFDDDLRKMVGKMIEEGFRAATLRELLAFGEANPELQRQFPIIALKARWLSPYRTERGSASSEPVRRDLDYYDSRHWCVAELGELSGGRSLNLVCWDACRWDRDCRFLAVMPMGRSFPIWKTIKLGTGIKDADDFRKAIKGAGMPICGDADYILSKPQFIVAAEEREIDLVVVSAADLGFKDGARFDQIYAKAKKLGLELCPLEVGPQLRLQYRDQRIDEWILVGMEPIPYPYARLPLRYADEDTLELRLGLFVVGRDYGGLWLEANLSITADAQFTDNRFVFVLPRR